MTEAAPPLRLSGEGASAEATSAVVLVRVTEAQFHLGLRHGAEPQEPVLHLAWHRLLRDQALGQVTQAQGHALPAAVVTLALDPLVEEVLLVLADRVASRYANQPSSIAYGLGDMSATFEERTARLTDPDAAFTCATFVLAMLRSVGVRLIDVTRWRAPTADDLRWQRETGERLLSWIEEQFHGDLPRAKERLTHDLGAPRYRPTDVAGSALFGPDTWPVGAEDVDPRARELETMLRWPGSSTPSPG